MSAFSTCVQTLLFSHCCVRLFGDTVDWSPPLSMGFSRQGRWSGWPCPPPGALPSPASADSSLPLAPPRSCPNCPNNSSLCFADRCMVSSGIWPGHRASSRIRTLRDPWTAYTPQVFPLSHTSAPLATGPPTSAFASLETPPAFHPVIPFQVPALFLPPSFRVKTLIGSDNKVLTILPSYWDVGTGHHEVLIPPQRSQTGKPKNGAGSIK